MSNDLTYTLIPVSENDTESVYTLRLTGPKEDRQRVWKAAYIAFETYVRMYYQTDGALPKNY